MWIVLGLVSAIADTGKNILAKKTSRELDPMVITWAWVTYSLVLLVPLMFIQGIPQLDTTFWIVFCIRIVIDTIALILYIRAITTTDLSLSLPMMALTPLFLLLTGAMLNKEFPHVWGIGGVVLIVLGAYLLNFKKKEHFLQPILAIYQNKGTFMMFITAVLWSVAIPLHKICVQHSNPYFYSGFGMIVLAAIFTPLAYFTHKSDFKKAISSRYLLKTIPVGILDGVAILSQMIGQGYTLSVYIIALKRLSILFSSLLGWYFFKEQIKQRLVPICLIVIGVILLALS